MNITFAQVADALNDCEILYSEHALCPIEGFTNIEILDGQLLESGVLYIHDKSCNKLGASCELLCSLDGNASLALAQVQGRTAAHVCNLLMNYVFRFQSCLDEMRANYYQNRNLEGLCRAMSNFIGNPVVAYDEDLIPILQVGFTREQANGYFGEDTISVRWMLEGSLEWKYLDNVDPLTRTDAYWSMSRDGARRTLLCNVFNQGKRVGVLELFELDQDLTKSHAQLLESACRIIELNGSFPQNSIAIKKLHGQDVRAEFSENWLAALHWKKNDGLYVLAVTFPKAYDGDEGMRPYFSRLLRDSLPNAVHVFIDESPVAIVNDRFDSRTNALASLVELMSRTKVTIRLGVSEIVTGSDLLHTAFDHARFCGRYAIARNMGPIVTFEQCKFAYFIDICKLEDNAAFVIDAHAARMFEDDKKTGAENTLTIKTYIESGFNLNATAKLLSVHRNTVVYRLKLIHDRYGIDLATAAEDSELVFQILLSTKLLTEMDD